MIAIKPKPEWEDELSLKNNVPKIHKAWSSIKSYVKKNIVDINIKKFR